ncbi:MAG: 2' O-ribose methyltransferase [Trizodia sp. TS-e1964]|nr:MAG: 2' O-ribose methyltransferase [Trizodia sp. TS-e1964]
MLSCRVILAFRKSALRNKAIAFHPNCCCSSTTLLNRSGVARDSSTSSSSKRWQSRQGKDKYVRDAKVQGLKSRAAFKLLEINDKYKLFKKGHTVVDLGYAPGSWSQVAVDRTAPNGRVLGIDIIPARPPKGASSIQGNFLSPSVQKEVKAFLQDPNRGRPRVQKLFSSPEAISSSITSEEFELQNRSPLESEPKPPSQNPSSGYVVDIVLSDMCAPWEQTHGFYNRSLSNPYYRMQNTSGLPFRDHANSMDLCMAALNFSFETLRPGGHFVCKFFAGAEDRALERRLRMLFGAVHREKPGASRSDSKEAYFVALRRRDNISRADLFKDSDG